jgi:hypothetical protein
MRTAVVRATAGVAVLASLIGPLAAQVIEVESFRVQLFSEDTGKLSEDISGRGIVWNALIGHAQANAFLLTVIIKGEPRSGDRTTVVTVSIVDDKSGRTLIRRNFKNFAFEEDGRVYKPLLVENRTCHPTRIVGRVKSVVKTLVMQFHCGE